MRRIREKFPEVVVVRFLKLVFDNDVTIVVDISTQYVRGVWTNSFLARLKLYLHTERFAEIVQVLLRRQPWRKIVSFVPPYFTKVNSLQFSQTFGYH